MNKTWTIILVIIVVILGIWWLNKGQSGISLYPSTSPTPVGATATPSIPKAKATATPVSGPVLSYSQLVAQYGSNRIQFDNDCKATPSQVVFKNGASILLDNRSATPAAITIAGSTYALGAYGYKVVTLTSSSLPKVLGVTCNGRVNTSSINLQANISGQ